MQAGRDNLKEWNYRGAASGLGEREFRVLPKKKLLSKSSYYVPWWEIAIEVDGRVQSLGKKGKEERGVEKCSR